MTLMTFDDLDEQNKSLDNTKTKRKQNHKTKQKKPRNDLAESQI